MTVYRSLIVTLAIAFPAIVSAEVIRVDFEGVLVSDRPGTVTIESFFGLPPRERHIHGFYSFDTESSRVFGASRSVGLEINAEFSTIVEFGFQVDGVSWFKTTNGASRALLPFHDLADEHETAKPSVQIRIGELTNNILATYPIITPTQPPYVQRAYTVLSFTGGQGDFHFPGAKLDDGSYGTLAIADHAYGWISPIIGASYVYRITSMTAVPEPATLSLLLIIAIAARMCRAK